MIRYFEAFAGIGAFRSAFEKVGGFECVGWCEIDKFAQQAYRALYDTGGEKFYEDITKSITEVCRILICWWADRAASPSASQGKDELLRTTEGICFSTLFKSLKPKDLAFLSLKMYPTCLVYRRECFRILLEEISQLGYSMCWRVLNSADFGIPQSRRRLFLVGYSGNRCPTEILAFEGDDEENCKKGKPKQLIGGSQGSRVYSTNGTAVTQCSGSGGMGGKTGLYFIDCNAPPNLTDMARCITTRQDSGVSNHKGEHSAVFVDDAPRAILNPFKEHTRQNGRRVKKPDEPMFTLTVTDRHGIVHKGRIRRLMPSECWKLQGFTKEQFEKVAAAGVSDSQLYKQAGNSITVNVVEAIGRNLLKFDKEVVQ